VFKIEHILSGDFSAYSREDQVYMEKYNERLRDYIIEELINDTAEKMLKDIDKSKDYFIEVLTDILNNGCKGFYKMSTRTLLNIYLERRKQEDFIRLLEKVSEEV
jgi:hypothetical protein